MSGLQDLWERSLHALLKHAPIEAASAIGSLLTRVNVRFFRKEISAGARRNLAIHYPEWTPAQVEAGVWRFLDNVGRLMGEFSVLHRLAREKRLTFSGFEPIQAIQGKEPLLAIALHTGNWEAMGAGLQHLGIKTATFYMPPASAAQRQIAIETRERLGFQLLSPDQKGLRDAIGILRANGNVIIFGDEARDGRAMAPLFGRPPHEHGNLAIAARLARKMNCRLAVSHVERLPDCHFRLHITAPFHLPDGVDRTLLGDVAFLNAQIEPIILKHLDSWYFLDDRIDPLE
jgi:KDO2-lipid IV(A) lauroyltransferase